MRALATALSRNQDPSSRATRKKHGMTTRNDDWILEAAEEADSAGMPPPERPPPYAPPGPYTRPWRIQDQQAFHIGSVGRREGRLQPLAPRSPLDFDTRHSVFDRVRFEIMPIPNHAMGVAYVNYADRLWMFARRMGHYHVAYRFATEPFALHTTRLSNFVSEATQRVGTRRWNSSRWFYFRWDTAEHGENGDLIL